MSRDVERAPGDLSHECPAARRVAPRASVIDHAFRVLAVLLGMAHAMVAFGAPLVVRDDRGVVHEFQTPPRRIITMLPSLTETAWVLGVGQRLVGVDRYSSWPVEISGLPRLGGVDDAHIEAIAALHPDVILAPVASRSMERLEQLGFTVIGLRAESQADVQRTLERIAQLLGTPGAAERVWQQLLHEIDAATARVPAAFRGQSVYFEIGGGPYAAGAGSFIGELMQRLGLRNIVPAELGPFPKLNPEYVVRARPRIIMGAERELAALATRPGWHTVPAVRDGFMCGYGPEQYDILIRPGPRLGEAAALLADCLQRLDMKSGR